MRVYVKNAALIVLSLFLIECSRQNGQRLFVGDGIAVAETEYGRVQGYVLDDVYTFLGIPYGASTAAGRRFMPPESPAPWNGVLPALFYGNVSPQKMEGRYTNVYSSFRDHWNYTDADEDCLSLNVWTKGIDSGRRPVLVWIHGGGFVSGNAIEQDSYHGANLADYGDIVFVSVNHRLNSVGFSDFSQIDDKFAESGNVGMLDIVKALEWVHDNIANFGGDPNNVTIMGQSGGGAKICTVMAMKEAGGLVHKGVALSGNAIDAIDLSYSTEIGRRIYECSGGDISTLQNMPWREYIELADSVATAYNKEIGVGRRLGGDFGPVGDGYHVPMGRFFSDPHSPSAKMPLLLCSTAAEASVSVYDAELEDIDFDKAVDLLRRRGMENAEEILRASLDIFPDMKPVDALNYCLGYRENVIKTADAKCKQEAPVYVALFSWRSPLFNGRMRSPHCSDISFWLRNTDLMLSHTGGGRRPDLLSRKMADALLNFMRNGNPNTKGLPYWEKYNPETRPTMVLSDKCELRYQMDDDLIDLLEAN